MEKRIGTVLLVINDKSCVPELNAILNAHSDIIIARQGIPLPERPFSIISLVIEGTTNTISSLTGKLGQMKSIQVKSVLIPN